MFITLFGGDAGRGGCGYTSTSPNFPYRNFDNPPTFSRPHPARPRCEDHPSRHRRVPPENIVDNTCLATYSWIAFKSQLMAFGTLLGLAPAAGCLPAGCSRFLICGFASAASRWPGNHENHTGTNRSSVHVVQDGLDQLAFVSLSLHLACMEQEIWSVSRSGLLDRICVQGE